MTLGIKIGALDITVLIDSRLTFDPGIFTDTTAEHVNGLLKDAGVSEVQTHCNSYVIRSGETVMMVDAGTGGLFGPTSGKLGEAMTEAGIKPADITHLFMTHLHPDHTAGAITSDGKAVFPNAELMLLEAERAFWVNDANFAGAPEDVLGWQGLAKGTVNAYKDRLKIVRDGEEIIPGVSVIGLPGHTPGHAGLRIESGGQTLVHMADVVHVQDVQLSDPSLGVVFDVDGAQARRSRELALDMLATDKLMVTGSHLRMPKFGQIVRHGSGYRYLDI